MFDGPPFNDTVPVLHALQLMNPKCISTFNTISPTVPGSSRRNICDTPQAACVTCHNSERHWYDSASVSYTAGGMGLPTEEDYLSLALTRDICLFIVDLFLLTFIVDLYYQSLCLERRY